MSYILEALKKSEQERDRERGALPDIKSVHAPTAVLQEEKRRWWPLVLILLLVIAGAAGTFVYLSYFKTQTVTTEQELATSAGTGDQTTPEKSQGSKSQAKTTTSDRPKSTSKSEPQKKSAAVEEQKQPSVVFSKQPLQHDDVIGNVDEQQKRAAASQAKQLQESAESESSVEVIAISDIPDNVRKNIPGIAFEGHVYSSVPERRSIMINGHKRREGDTIGEDLTVREITPVGAEFEFQGYRFRLNALQDWSFR